MRAAAAKRTFVRVVLHGHFPVGFLDFALAGCLLDPQDLIHFLVVHLLPAPTHTTHAAHAAGHTARKAIESSAAEEHGAKTACALKPVSHCTRRGRADKSAAEGKRTGQQRAAVRDVSGAVSRRRQDQRARVRTIVRPHTRRHASSRPACPAPATAPSGDFSACHKQIRLEHPKFTLLRPELTCLAGFQKSAWSRGAHDEQRGLPAADGRGGPRRVPD